MRVWENRRIALREVSWEINGSYFQDLTDATDLGIYSPNVQELDANITNTRKKFVQFSVLNLTTSVPGAATEDNIDVSFLH